MPITVRDSGPVAGRGVSWTFRSGSGGPGNSSLSSRDSGGGGTSPPWGRCSARWFSPPPARCSLAWPPSWSRTLLPAWRAPASSGCAAGRAGRSARTDPAWPSWRRTGLLLLLVARRSHRVAAGLLLGLVRRLVGRLVRRLVSLPIVPLMAAISPVVAGDSLLPTCTSTPRSRSERSTRITTNPDSPVSRSRSPTLRCPSVSDTSARSSGFSASRSTVCPSGTARIASKLRPGSLVESGPDFI